MADSEKSKKKTNNRRIARKIFMPEFNKSFLAIKVSVDNFVRLIAGIFLTAGLLDEEDDVFTTNQHLGVSDFGEIIVVAARNIDWRKKTSIPKICLWLSAVCLVVFVVSALLMLMFSLVAGGVSMAMAQGADTSLFLLDSGKYPDIESHEYGTTWINWLFNLTGEPMPVYSDVASDQTMPVGESGFKAGFISMLTYYSSACLVLGSIIVSYLFVENVIETAHSGKFMGDADEVWAFPRILIAMCLLVPVGSNGLNIGQNIVIGIAKTGSIFATNAWLAFFEGMKGLDEEGTMVELSELPLRKFSESMFRNYVCYWGASLVSNMYRDDGENAYKSQRDQISTELQKLDSKASEWNSKDLPQDAKTGYGYMPDECKLVKFDSIYNYDWEAQVNTSPAKARDDCYIKMQYSSNRNLMHEADSVIAASERLVKKDAVLSGLESSTNPVVFYKIDNVTTKGATFRFNSGSPDVPGITNACGGFTYPLSSKKWVDQFAAATTNCSFEGETTFNLTAKAFDCVENNIKAYIGQAYRDTETVVRPDDADSAGVSTFDPKEYQMFIAEVNDEKIEIPVVKGINPYNELSAYAYNLVLSVLQKEASDKVVNFQYTGMVEDDPELLLQGSGLTSAMENFETQIRKFMGPGIDDANQTFNNFNKAFFGSKGVPGNEEIEFHMRRGWIAAGAFYPLLSRLNSLGMSAGGHSFVSILPDSGFVGALDSAKVKKLGYDSTEASGYMDYLDLLMDKAGLAVNNESIENTGVPETSAIGGDPVSLSNRMISSNLGLLTHDFSAFRKNPVSALVSLGHSIINVASNLYGGIITAKALAMGVDKLAQSTAASAPFGTGLPAAITRFATGSLVSSLSDMMMLMRGVIGMLFAFGFTLAYYLPLVPFLKFISGAVGWFAAVFQAVLGAPLLLLSAISVQKKGFLLGPNRGGYMMIVEIFLRPILMVFGLIGSILILTIGVYIFTDLYNFAWATTDMAADVSDFGFAIVVRYLAYICIYVMTVYGLANMCFKLIDDVPAKVITWLGGGMGYTMSGGDDLGKAGAGAAAGAAGKLAGGAGDVMKRHDDQARDKKKNDADTDNKIKLTAATDGKEKAQLLADSEGKELGKKGDYVDMDKDTAKAARDHANEYINSGGKASEYVGYQQTQQGGAAAPGAGGAQGEVKPPESGKSKLKLADKDSGGETKG